VETRNWNVPFCIAWRAGTGYTGLRLKKSHREWKSDPEMFMKADILSPKMDALDDFSDFQIIEITVLDDTAFRQHSAKTEKVKCKYIRKC
jgi:hypothetical protein